MKKMKALVGGLVACVVLGGGVAFADVTGDFKVTGYSYIDGVANVSGTVNHGAIQSKKMVVVDVTYAYSFAAEKVEIIPGETIEAEVFVPGKCTLTTFENADNDTKKACWDKNGVPKALNGAIWKGEWVISTITTPDETITTTVNPQGMIALTEPTIDSKGRLNPKGKITGYNWSNTTSIVANDTIVDSNLIPDGYTLIAGSVTIISVDFKAYLKDALGVQFPDTVVTGVLYPAP